LDGFAARIKIKFQIPIRHPPHYLAEEWRMLGEINSKQNQNSNLQTFCNPSVYFSHAERSAFHEFSFFTPPYPFLLLFTLFPLVASRE